MKATPDKWLRREWGWTLETADGRWCSQVYREPPISWSVFMGEDLIASGFARTPNLARRRGKAVLLALVPRRVGK